MSKGSRSAQTEATNADLSRKKGMILPFEPLSITFDNIKYSVDMPQVDSNVKTHMFILQLELFIYLHHLLPNYDMDMRELMLQLPTALCPI